MNLQVFISSQNKEDSELTLDLCSFILRYRKELDYSDFSKNKGIINKIRRAEVIRSWADIEELAKAYQALTRNLEKQREVTTNAFKETVKLVETVKTDCLKAVG